MERTILYNLFDTFKTRICWFIWLGWVSRQVWVWGILFHQY